MKQSTAMIIVGILFALCGAPVAAVIYDVGPAVIVLIVGVILGTIGLFQRIQPK